MADVYLADGAVACVFMGAGRGHRSDELFPVGFLRWSVGGVSGVCTKVHF